MGACSYLFPLTKFFPLRVAPMTTNVYICENRESVFYFLNEILYGKLSKDKIKLQSKADQELSLHYRRIPYQNLNFSFTDQSRLYSHM